MNIYFIWGVLILEIIALAVYGHRQRRGEILFGWFWPIFSISVLDIFFWGVSEILHTQMAWIYLAVGQILLLLAYYLLESLLDRR